jgi:DNA-binding NtrC family response regulator
MEAHLFGHTRGAFTGATAAANGLFVDADGGTLLLDEIADLPLPQQAKLLRVIEERAVVPLGGSKPRSLDVRILAASQMPLRERVDQGRFRGDLLARLAGATLTIPSLAERREEIPLLFTRFFGQAGGDPGRLQSTLVEKLCLLDWTFNVRQLKLLSESMAVLYPTGPLGAVELEETLGKNTSLLPEAPAVVLHRSIPATEMTEELSLLGRRRALWLERNSDQARRLAEAVRRHGGNVSKAAREVGLSRQRAQRLLEAMQARSVPPR